MNIQIDDESIGLIAEMGQGNPRETRMVLKRVYDFAFVLQNGVITNDLTKKALGLMEATGLKKTN